MVCLEFWDLGSVRRYDYCGFEFPNPYPGQRQTPVVFLWMANQRKIRVGQLAHILYLVCLSSFEKAAIDPRMWRESDPIKGSNARS